MNYKLKEVSPKSDFTQTLQQKLDNYKLGHVSEAGSGVRDICFFEFLVGVHLSRELKSCYKKVNNYTYDSCFP